jgi:hypothetical protein
MVSNIYILWLGFIKHGDTSDDTVALYIDGDGDSSYVGVGSVGNFMLITNSFIADSIMVLRGLQFLLSIESENRSYRSGDVGLFTIAAGQRR